MMQVSTLRTIQLIKVDGIYHGSDGSLEVKYCKNGIIKKAVLEVC